MVLLKQCETLEASFCNFYSEEVEKSNSTKNSLNDCSSLPFFITSKEPSVLLRASFRF